ncbi:MAG: hypothetical protein WAM60_19100 [Candidatus Promineifilaceae bacterium]
MLFQPADTNKTVIFLHIPKTAGTTLDQIIYRHYRFKEVYQTGLIAQQGVKAFKEMSEEERRSYRLLKGQREPEKSHRDCGPPGSFFH